MDAELIRAFGAPLLSAILGGLIVHFAARRRDVENERRRQRIEYLIGAYQVLVQSAHRELKDERAEAFENAISDVILLGNDDQIDLARKLIKAFAQDKGAPIDELLMSLRGALRRELGLAPGKLGGTPAIRIVTDPTPQSAPLKLKDAAEIQFAKVSAVTAKTVLSATSKIIPKRGAGKSLPNSMRINDEPLRDIADKEPIQAINAGYEALSSALLHLLEDDTGSAEMRGLPELAEKAAQRSLVSPEFVQTAQGLDALRNLAVNDPRSRTTSQQANEYLDLIAAAFYVVSSSPGVQESQ